MDSLSSLSKSDLFSVLINGISNCVYGSNDKYGMCSINNEETRKSIPPPPLPRSPPPHRTPLRPSSTASSSPSGVSGSPSFLPGLTPHHLGSLALGLLFPSPSFSFHTVSSPH